MLLRFSLECKGKHISVPPTRGLLSTSVNSLKDMKAPERPGASVPFMVLCRSQEIIMCPGGGGESRNTKGAPAVAFCKIYPHPENMENREKEKIFSN